MARIDIPEYPFLSRAFDYHILHVVRETLALKDADKAATPWKSF